MPAKLTINSDRSCEEGLEQIRALYKAKKFLRISILVGPARSTDQNSCFFHLYELIAEWFYGKDLEMARNECKLQFGLPILRRDDDAFNELCSKSVDTLPYEKQLKLVSVMDVTSLMSRAQGVEYINTIIDTYAEQGIMWPPYLTKQRDKLGRSHVHD